MLNTFLITEAVTITRKLIDFSILPMISLYYFLYSTDGEDFFISHIVIDYNIFVKYLPDKYFIVDYIQSIVILKTY